MNADLDWKKQLAAMRRYLYETNKEYPIYLVDVPECKWPESFSNAPIRPIKVMRSRWFLVQIFLERPASDDLGLVHRLSVCRTELDGRGMWKDGMTWDELQLLKSEAGFGDKDAVEIYPSDKDIVCVANMRHLFVIDKPIALAWRGHSKP